MENISAINNSLTIINPEKISLNDNYITYAPLENYCTITNSIPTVTIQLMNTNSITWHKVNITNSPDYTSSIPTSCSYDNQSILKYRFYADMDNNGFVTYNLDNFNIVPNSKKELFKQNIKSNLKAINSSKKTRSYSNSLSFQEQKARNTLRDLITEKEWRRYLTNQYVMIKGHLTNNYYQVFATGGMMNVYQKGKLIATHCIHTHKSCPPTDHILNVLFLAKYDESTLLAAGNFRPKDISPNTLLNGVDFNTIVQTVVVA